MYMLACQYHAGAPVFHEGKKKELLSLFKKIKNIREQKVIFKKNG